MSVVGEFPGLGLHNRRTIRAEVNPMDKSTIISIYPRNIDEIKPTIQPGRFKISAGSIEKPSILVVGPSSWWKDMGDENQPLLEIPNSSIQVANSIVRDYCNGLLACNMVDRMPGLFWVPGEFDLVQALTKHRSKFTEAETKQRNYYTALVSMADTLWARTNGNPLVISDDMRLAARGLGLEGKDWMKDFTMLAMTKCVACGSPRNTLYPVCPTCKAVDKIKAKELGIVFAEN